MTTTETSAGKFRKTQNSNQQQEVLELSCQAYDNFWFTAFTCYKKLVWLRSMQIHEASEGVYSWRAAEKYGQAKDGRSSNHIIIVSLRKPPYSLRYQTLNLNLSAVVTFYAMNDVSLNRKKVARHPGKPTVAHRDRAYSVDEILRLLQFCDQRSKAIVLLMPATGLA